MASWNVNSIRSRREQLLTWLVERRIDVALLQETKCHDDLFPFGELATLGYEAAHHGVDHWNGVAIVSRVGLTEVVRGFDTRPDLVEPRLIAATCGDVRFWSVYVPNGRAIDDPHFAYKLDWLDQLAVELHVAGAHESDAVVAGDFNVGPADIDFYDPKRWRGKKHATPEERARVQLLIELGLVDIVRLRHPDKPMFSWWNYVGTQFAKDKGLRIDLALVAPALVDRVDDVWVDRHARDPLTVHPAKPSDHAPLILELLRPQGA